MRKLHITRTGFSNFFVTPSSKYTCYLHITHHCNYHCSYCMIKNRLEKSQWSREILFKNIDWICNDKKTSDIFFFGGEPLIHPDFLDAITYCKEKTNCKLSTLTNGSMPLSFFQKLYSLDPDFKTSISLHLEKLSQDSFMEKALFLIQQKQGSHFKLMLHPGYRNKAIKLFEALRDIVSGTNSSISCSLIRFPAQNFNSFSPEYTDEDWEFYKKINKMNRETNRFFIELSDINGCRYILQTEYSDALKKGLLHFKGLACSINSNKCIFDSSGRAKSIVCDPSKKNITYKKYGEQLYQDKPVVCNLNRCWCDDHMLFPKWCNKNLGMDVNSGHAEKIEINDIFCRKEGDSYSYFLNDGV